MGHQKTARILSRKGSAVEIHHTGISTSERMRRSVSEELQSGPKESCWRANIDALRVIHVSVRSGESRQRTSNWPHTKRPWWWIVRLSEWHAARSSNVSRATRPFQGNQQYTSASGVCSEDCRLVLEALDMGCVSSLIPRKKWNAEKRNVQVDDFVIVQTPNAICGNWNIGRIVNVYPGQDSKVRNVRVKTGIGEYDRPVERISVVYPADL